MLLPECLCAFYCFYYSIYLTTSMSFLIIITFSLQSFSIITIFFNHYNLFQLSQSFSIIIIFFNYHNLFQSLYSLCHYLYQNEPTYEFHHLTHTFYRQNMIKIFCQFHIFLICVFYFKFFSFCV